jgi:hypothetical protein
MDMNSMDRFSQSAAEDGQRSVVLSGDQAKVLNFLDRAIAEIERARAINDDVTDDKVMASWVQSIRGFQNDIQEGY